MILLYLSCVIMYVYFVHIGLFYLKVVFRVFIYPYKYSVYHSVCLL
jgi:hypothetical protein